MGNVRRTRRNTIQRAIPSASTLTRVGATTSRPALKFEAVSRRAIWWILHLLRGCRQMYRAVSRTCRHSKAGRTDCGVWLYRERQDEPDLGSALRHIGTEVLSGEQLLADRYHLGARKRPT